MKISKRLIKKVANELLEKNGRITQYEVHYEISQRLGRTLTPGEKRRITVILKNEYFLEKVEIEKDTRIRIEFFTF